MEFLIFFCRLVRGMRGMYHVVATFQYQLIHYSRGCELQSCYPLSSLRGICTIYVQYHALPLQATPQCTDHFLSLHKFIKTTPLLFERTTQSPHASRSWRYGTQQERAGRRKIFFFAYSYQVLGSWSSSMYVCMYVGVFSSQAASIVDHRIM